MLPASSSSALQAIRQVTPSRTETPKTSHSSDVLSGTSIAARAAPQPTTLHSIRNVRRITRKSYRPAVSVADKNVPHDIRSGTYPPCISFFWLTVSPSSAFKLRNTAVETRVIPPKTKKAR